MVLFGGKGGVGKTTCAVATALAVADSAPRQSFLLVSTDPAHSLRDSLADTEIPVNLEVLELDPRKSLDAFHQLHLEQMRQIADRGTFLDRDDINRLLDLSLPGLDELMAFLDLAGWVENKKYDAIIVDTAPTGHALRLMQMPKLMLCWLEALDALLGKHRYMMKLFRGHYEVDEADLFLINLNSSIKAFLRLITDRSRCRFVPVTIAEELALAETEALLQSLSELGVHSPDIVVNRLRPGGGCSACEAQRRHQLTNLESFDRKVYSLWGLPQFPAEVRGPSALSNFWAHSKTLDLRHDDDEGTEEVPPGVDDPADLPPPDIKMLLFAGKGGVGKTTLACATSIALAEEERQRKILVVSVDPAHSLSSCFDLKIEAQPVPVAERIFAMQLDAEQEFDGLKQAYSEDIAALFGQLSPKIDLAFDREVMERMLDLAPPGIDEVMALTVATDFVSDDSYDTLVLDTAPTGHLLRILEMPDLVDQWLKVFFGLLLKYRGVLHAPRISERLVKLSKDLKRLRSILGDGRRSAVYVVSVPTRMALSETEDLLTACELHGVHVAGIFANLVTAEAPCGFCSALRKGETEVLAGLHAMCPASPLTLVYRGSEPRGFARLRELALRLYRRAGDES